MYREHFGLTTAPFGISPRLDFLFRSVAFEESMAHLLYGLESSEAVVLITGAIGTGKTMAVQSFLAHLGDRFLTALVTNTRVDGKELLKLVLEDLGRPIAGAADKSDLLIAFKQLLVESSREGRRVVIVIDEAQNLDRDVLEEIRLLTNLGQGDDQPVQVVLVGQPELDRNIGQPELAQLRQRIRVHCRLAPLSRVELAGYVDRRIEVAGGRPGLFSTAALDRIYELSGGIPRVVNTLCGDAMLSAFVAGRRTIERQDVGERTLGPAADDRGSVASDVAASAPASAPVAELDHGLPQPIPRRAAGSEMAVRRGDESHSRRGKAGVWWTVATIAVIAAALAFSGQWRVIRDLAVGRQEAATERASVAHEPVNVASGQTGEDGTIAQSPAGSLEAPPPAAADPVESRSLVGSDSTVVAVSRGVVDATPTGMATAAEDAGDAAQGAIVLTAAQSPGAEIPTARPAVGDLHAEKDWYIHVSSFRTAPHAASVAEGFGRNGVSAMVREQVVRDVTWHRVYLGPFTSHAVAVMQANAMRDAGDITYYKVQQMTPDGGS